MATYTDTLGRDEAAVNAQYLDFSRIDTEDGVYVYHKRKATRYSDLDEAGEAIKRDILLPFCVPSEVEDTYMIACIQDDADYDSGWKTMVGSTCLTQWMKLNLRMTALIIMEPWLSTLRHCMMLIYRTTQHQVTVLLLMTSSFVRNMYFVV